MNRGQRSMYPKTWKTTKEQGEPWSTHGSRYPAFGSSQGPLGPSRGPVGDVLARPARQHHQPGEESGDPSRAQLRVGGERSDLG